MTAGARPGRVVVGPTEVAGIANGLVEGFTRLGLAAEMLLESDHPYGYAGRLCNVPLARWWRRAGTWARRLPMSRAPLKFAAAALHLILAWPVFAYALWRYQSFVFVYGRSFTNTAFELWVLRRLRRPVVVFFVGSDARPPYVNGALRGDSPRRLLRDTRRTQRRVRRFERGGATCINAPGTAHFHRDSVINWFAIGFPRSIAAAPPADGDPASLRTGVVQALHSPSHPHVKGTGEIVAAVERLRARGVPIELRTITASSNAEVLDALRECDLVVDQLYSDTPMAGLATEAAQLGRPTLVGGYFAAEMPESLGGQPAPPTRFVVPEAFETTLEALVRDANARTALGHAAREFVLSHWDCGQVAQRVLRLLQGERPQTWCYDPSRVSYLAGCGLTAEAARERVRTLLAYGGPSALHLSDKPALEAAFIAWARQPVPAGRRVREGAAP
jgi:hypothetical protein